VINFLSKILPKTALLFLANVCLAEIELPEQVTVGQKIVAKVTDPVPENGKLTILWNAPFLDTEQAESKLFIWGKANKTYSVDAVVIPLKTITVDNQTFDVIAGNIARYNKFIKIIGSIDPDPDPDPEPPDPTDVPFLAPGYAVLIITEKSEMGLLPVEQQAIFTSQRILDKLSQLCIKLNDGYLAFRIWDDDYTQEHLVNTPDTIKVAYADVVKQANGRLPWIAISNINKGFSGPLPKTINQTLNLLEEYK
jgi:hypothetical protein